MQINDVKRKLISLYINSRGWRTIRKLVVIESDDWGSIRMPSREVYEKFLKLGFPVDKLSYHKYDSLEGNRDLEALFEVLTGIKDSNGNHPVITANTIMTNPDFNKISQSGFREYHYELFTETLKRYPEHDRVPELYRSGIENKIFIPQLHGREHLNVKQWMKALEDSEGWARRAFEHEFYDLSDSHSSISENSFVDAFTLENPLDIEDQKASIREGAKLFFDVFGYRSDSFIAPVYIWRNELEGAMSDSGIKYIQGNVYQKIPVIGERNSFAKKLHFTGEKNKSGMLYLVRNASFEPSSFKTVDHVTNCLNQVARSFNNRKPAIICSHRLNFIGSLDRANRETNLVYLQDLLKSIVKKWPDVEFISSDKLGSIISKANN
ncbi:MAG: hypothetical protein IPF68_08545 [Bacteroidales bacterium]|nr:hypothetical protein [Bacteroidales bacterium]